MSNDSKAFVEFPRESILNLLRTVGNSGADGADLLRTGGAAAAESLGEALTGQLDGQDPADLPLDEFWRELETLFSRLGWGSIRQESLHPGVVSLVSPDWFEAEENHGDLPCCHFSTGLLAALLQRLAGSDIAAMEVECRGAGNAECRFLLGSPEALDELYEVIAEGGSFRDAIAALT